MLAALLAAALVAVLVVAGARAVRWASGGGTLPAQVLPADARAYLAVDLDPPAGQKLQVLRLLRSLPDGPGGDREDLRRAAYDLLARGGGLDGVDWERDVDPWLGDRVGVALRPPVAGGSGGPARAAAPVRPVAALAVRDEDAARAALGRLAGRGGGPGWVLLDGYALLAPDQAQAEDAARAAQDRPLADDPGFASDVDALGGRGVATAWAATAALAAPALAAALDASGASGGTAAGRALVTGADLAAAALGPRTAAVLRVDDGRPRLVARTSGGWARPAGAAPPGLAGLPVGTAAALAVHGLGGALTAGWDRLVEEDPLVAGVLGGAPGQRTAVEDRLALELPAGLVPLAGEDLALALRPGGADGAALRVRHPDPEGAGRALERLLALAGRAGALPERATTDGRLVVATTPSARGALEVSGSTGPGAAAGPALGEEPRVAEALPRLEQAVAAAYVDLDGLAPPGGWAPGSAPARLAGAFAAAGATLAVPAPGVLELDLRLLPR
ncbi:DUF3352 domain-containing protein [Vallicoccus soli]|uniref:DUF3352 domain-containing protein n=1 Tax=Vallicoccus soli TaxID=2339232 RepID=UPI001403999F|nr:DUF3352 domain-containing protein [Vallicoccus soli]